MSGWGQHGQDVKLYQESFTNHVLGDDTPVIGYMKPAVITKPERLSYKDVNPNDKDSLLAAIAKTMGLLETLGPQRKTLLERTVTARQAIANLKAALAIAEQFRSDADGSLEKFKLAYAGIERDLETLRQQYADLITRQKAEADWMAELEFLESLTADWMSGPMPPFKHQLEGAQVLFTERRCILGDEMGLGKTRTVTMAIDILAKRWGSGKKVIIVTPNDVQGNFIREIDRWSPNRVIVALGMYKNKKVRHTTLRNLQGEDEFILMVNYEVWRSDTEIVDMIIGLECDTIIIDEAHNIKESGSINFKRIKKIVYAQNSQYACEHCNSKFDAWPMNSICPDFECGARMKQQFNGNCSIKNVYPMTGTVILNHPKDLWPLLYLIDNVAFYNENAFLNQYCKQDWHTSLTGSQVKRWTFQWGGAERLLKRVGAKYLRRNREDAGIVLPKQEIQEHWLEFEEGEYLEQQTAIRQIKEYNQVILDSGDALLVVHLLAMITRLRQVITWPAGIQFRNPENRKQVIGTCEVRQSIKVDAVEKDIIAMADAGQRVVVFSQFRAPLEELSRRLNEADITNALLVGNVDREVRDEIAIDFDRKATDPKNSKYQVVLCTYKAGGVGLNFTGATQTIIMDREWNEGKEDQAIGRTYRIGQTEETTVHIYRVRGTIDEDIDDLLAGKAAMVGGFDKAEEDKKRETLIEYLNRKFKES